jgi:hypothetical protein
MLKIAANFFHYLYHTQIFGVHHFFATRIVDNYSKKTFTTCSIVWQVIVVQLSQPKLKKTETVTKLIFAHFRITFAEL